MIIWNQYHQPPMSFIQTMLYAISSRTNSCELISINFIEGNTQKTVLVKVGDNLLNICKKHNIQIIGACEGNCACSTCHIILEENLYNKLPPPKEEEEDMLDLAYGVRKTSRLACQVNITKDFNNTKIFLLEKQRNVTFDIQNQLTKH